MTTRSVLLSAAGGALAAACVAAPALAAPTLRSADIRIRITSPTSCEVTMDLTVTGAPDVDHRIEFVDGSRVELVEVRGARRNGDIRVIGRTQSLVLSPGQSPYGLHYRTVRAGREANRCPLWLPAVPSDGRAGAVRLTVDIPAGTFAGHSMPGFIWTGTQGSAALAHIPSHVTVSYGPEGVPRGWDVGRIMDTLAVTIFAAASALWLWRAKR